MSQIVASNRRNFQRAPLPAMTALALAACTLAMIACILALAPAARAGEWVQRSCSYGTEYIVPEGWEGKEVNGYKNPNQDRPFDGCLGFNTGGGLDAGAAGDNGNQAGAGEIWLYRAPHESTIAGGILTATLTATNGYATIDAWAKNGLVTLANCESPNCHGGSRFVPITASGGTELYEAAGCFGTDGGLCPSEPNFAAEAGITSAQIVLATTAVPAGAGFSGTLLGETVAGKGTLSFTAKDPGPGVYQARAQIDGHEAWADTPILNGGKCVSTGSYEGARAFNYAQPCPTETAVHAEIDTTNLADGTHTLTVEVEDAAGNVAPVYSGTLITANHPVSTETPPSTALLSPAPVRGPANGTPASESATLTAQWKGESGKSADHLASAYRRSHEVTGKLTTTAGAPIVGALIEASQKPAYLGAIASTLASTHTATNGSFTISVPRTISSTSIQLAYRSHLGDAQPAATHMLTLQVPASVHLAVAPHVSSIYHTIVFTGMVHGAPIPPGGKQLVLEARSPGHEWIQFDTLATDAKGRYRASYRFKFAGPIGYQFRVVCKHEADFPFLAGNSNVVRVWER